MKTAEEILQSAYDRLVKKQDSSHDTVDPILLEAMQEYADQFKPKWISVEERLPPMLESVLVLTTLEARLTGFIDSSSNWNILFREGVRKSDPMIYGHVVTHWMPLPTKP